MKTELIYHKWSSVEFDESVKHLRHALAINPEVADIHQNLGVSLFAQRHFDEAIKHYHQALDIDPNHANTHNCLGEALVNGMLAMFLGIGQQSFGGD